MARRRTSSPPQREQPRLWARLSLSWTGNSQVRNLAVVCIEILLQSCNQMFHSIAHSHRPRPMLLQSWHWYKLMQQQMLTPVRTRHGIQGAHPWRLRRRPDSSSGEASHLWRDLRGNTEAYIWECCSETRFSRCSRPPARLGPWRASLDTPPTWSSPLTSSAIPGQLASTSDSKHGNMEVLPKNQTVQTSSQVIHCGRQGWNSAVSNFCEACLLVRQRVWLLQQVYWIQYTVFTFAFVSGTWLMMMIVSWYMILDAIYRSCYCHELLFKMFNLQGGGPDQAHAGEGRLTWLHWHGWGGNVGLVIWTIFLPFSPLIVSV